MDWLRKAVMCLLAAAAVLSLCGFGYSLYGAVRASIEYSRLIHEGETSSAAGSGSSSSSDSSSPGGSPGYGQGYGAGTGTGNGTGTGSGGTAAPENPGAGTGSGTPSSSQQPNASPGAGAGAGTGTGASSESQPAGGTGGSPAAGSSAAAPPASSSGTSPGGGGSSGTGTGTGAGAGTGSGSQSSGTSSAGGTGQQTAPPFEDDGSEPAVITNFELPVRGATGYPVINVNVRAEDSDSSQQTGVIQAGTPFVILSEGTNRLHVRTEDGTEGWVSRIYTLVNLPDVLPSIQYRNTNGSGSAFKCLGKDIPGVTGIQLYSSKYWNSRLGRDEYAVPVLYSMAVKLAKVQADALAEGKTLVIYEGYRPYSVQQKVRSGLDSLAGRDREVYQAINGYPWSRTWFISSGTSNHQRGFAVDMSLAAVEGMQDIQCGGFTVSVPTGYKEYEMPTAMHELSPRAARYTGPNTAAHTDTFNASAGAADLERLCKGRGLSPLQSEWWHFNDYETSKLTGSAGTGNWEITGVLSFAPKKPAEAATG